MLYKSVREMRGRGCEKRIRRPSQGSNVWGCTNFKSEDRIVRGYTPGSSGSWSYGVADDQPTLMAAVAIAVLGACMVLSFMPRLTAEAPAVRAPWGLG